MKKNFYRKYRPKTFEEIVGQEPIVRTLQNQIKNDSVGHAYLFVGSRGTGKTSAAKIFAKMLNCKDLSKNAPCDSCVSCTQIKSGSNTDIIEIDAASNNGVEEIRELKNKVNLVPSYSKFKIYIIDEVHMMTTQAFNALLKTLEEPPSHSIFILATTDPEKIPTTVLSRCQRFDFKKIPNSLIIDHLKKISDKEKIKFEEEALEEIAFIADGGLRDAISIFDQVSAFTNNNVLANDVHMINGTLTKQELLEFINDISEHRFDNVLKQIDKFIISGKDLIKITEEIIYFLKDYLIFIKAPVYFKNSGNNTSYEKINISEPNIRKIISILLQNINDLKATSDQKLIFELAMIDIFDKIINNVELKKLDIKEKVEKSENISKIKKSTEEITSNDNLKVSSEKKLSVDLDTLNEIKKIRINNSLANLDKKTMTKIKNHLVKNRLNNVDEKYNYVNSLLHDGNIKAYGNKTLIMVFEDEVSSKELNEHFVIVDEYFSFLFGETVKFIAVDKKEWEKIKDDFNNKKIDYVYKEEKFDIQKFAKKYNEEDSEILKTFGNLVEIR